MSEFVRQSTGQLYKAGANFSDQNRIKAWAEQGYSAEEIAVRVGIMAYVVEKFLPKKAAPAKKKTAKKTAKKPAVSDSSDEIDDLV